MEFQPGEKKIRLSQAEKTDSTEKPDNSGPRVETKPVRSEKRRDYITWEDYFMALAFLTAQRSKDPLTQVGAVIVDDSNRIVGMGYNGFPKGISDDEFSWGKNDNENPLNNKNYYVCHAEVNAVLNKNCASIRGCRVFVSDFPCPECTKLIVQSEMKEVIYANDKKCETVKIKASKKMLDAAGIKYRLFEPTQLQILIDFTSKG